MYLFFSSYKKVYIVFLHAFMGSKKINAFILIEPTFWVLGQMMSQCKAVNVNFILTMNCSTRKCYIVIGRS